MACYPDIALTFKGDGAVSVCLPGLPVAECGATLEEAAAAVVRALREYAARGSAEAWVVEALRDRDDVGVALWVGFPYGSILKGLAR